MLSEASKALKGVPGSPGKRQKDGIARRMAIEDGQEEEPMARRIQEAGVKLQGTQGRARGIARTPRNQAKSQKDG
jgi:hypothetical protein